MKKMLFVALLPFLIMACTTGETKVKAKAFNTIDSLKTSPSQSKPVETWTYIQSKDKMTDDVIYFAESYSTNKVDFDFPYNGGSTFTLTVRNRNKKNDLALVVSKGQFISSFSGDKTVRVKFDNEKPVNYTISSPTSGNHDIVFINGANKFINRLKAAQVVKIEAEFYNSGYSVAEFDVWDFKWDHK